MEELELEISEVWINPGKVQHQPPAHPDIGFAPAGHNKTTRSRCKKKLRKNCPQAWPSEAKPCHYLLLPRLCVYLFLPVCPHSHYHNETWRSAIAARYRRDMCHSDTSAQNRLPCLVLFFHAPIPASTARYCLVCAVCLLLGIFNIESWPVCQLTRFLRISKISLFLAGFGQGGQFEKSNPRYFVSSRHFSLLTRGGGGCIFRCTAM